MLNKYVHRSDSTVYRIIDGVAIMVSAPEGKLRTLNNVGTLIWQHANGRHTMADIIDLICQEFDVTHTQAMNDAEAFVQELADKNMLVLTDSPVLGG